MFSIKEREKKNAMVQSSNVTAFHTFQIFFFYL